MSTAPTSSRCDARSSRGIRTQALLQKLQKALVARQAHAIERGNGVIVNMASASGLAADFGFAAYNAAKGGVVNYTRAVAIDHARQGVRCNVVCPGPIETAPKANIDRIPGARSRWEDSVPMGRFGSAEEVAAVVAFLASDDASYVTGAILSVDGGISAGWERYDTVPPSNIAEGCWHD